MSLVATTQAAGTASSTDPSLLTSKNTKTLYLHNWMQRTSPNFCCDDHSNVCSQCFAARKSEKEINGTLATAQVHAQTYLNVILPSLIGNINNILAYYDLHAAVASTLPVVASEEAWVAAKIATTTYSSATANVVASLKALQTNFETDLKGFQTITSELNNVVNCDNGLLEQEDAQLRSIQSNINGAIAGVVLSGLGIAGGVFMIVVGSITSFFFVTAGTSTKITLAGIGMLTTAVGGEVASAVTLASLNDKKCPLEKSSATEKSILILE
jgi:hypothetical protein